MATKKKKSNKSRSRSTKKQDIIKIGGISIAKQKLIMVGGAVIAVIILVWFVNSSFWPWPSSAEIGRRLNDVIDACMYNERSRGCSSLQEKYHITFEYCHLLADIPEIGKKIPVYGVAKREGMREKAVWYRGGDKTSNKFPYYSCVSNIEDIENNRDTDLLANEPSSLALFALYKTPQYRTTGDYYQCHVSVDPGYNFLWNQIPNMEAIKNESKIAIKTYNKCGQQSDLQKELDKINSKILSYAQNRVVQRFFQNYDNWNLSSSMRPVCTFMEKEFFQMCGGENSGNSLADFAKDMQSYVSTDDFTSKILITD